MREAFCITINPDCLLKWMVRLFVLFLPIIWLPNIPQDIIQSMFFDYGCVSIFFVSLLVKPKRQFYNYNIPIIFLYSSIYFIFNKTFSPALLHLLCGMLFYYSIVTTMDIEEIPNITIILFMTAYINIIALFFQLIGMDLIYEPKDTAEAANICWPLKCGFMGLNKHLALFLALVSGFCYSYYWLALILILGVILYLKSLTALLGFVTILLLVFSQKRKINIRPYLVILPLISVVFIFVTKSFYKFTVRWETWSVLLKDLFSNIFWGKGIGNFKMNIPITWTGNTKETIINSPSFCEYIRRMYEFGVLPFLIIALGVFLYFRNLYLKTRHYNDVQILSRVVIAIMVMELFQDLLCFPRLGGPILLIIALFELSMITKKEAVC